ncbi:MAG: hypothetical protein ACI4Q5_04630 [Porcipelethomonas sp.]
MYLGKTRIFITKFISIVLISGSSLLLFITICGFFMDLSEKISGTMESEVFAYQMGIWIPLAIFCGLILALSIFMIKFAGEAFYFNSVFESDADGVLSVEKTALMFGMVPVKFMKLFNRLVRFGYLKNCTISNESGELSIVLNNGKKKVDQKFDVIQCPHCGAANDIKLGFVEKCKYCGNKLQENESDDAEVKK